MREIVFHRQAYSVDVRKQVNNYNGRLSELWASEVGAAAGALFGVRPSDFPPDYEVHIVSSNTHSVSNCISPFFPAHADEILAWGASQGLHLDGWTEPFDEVYHLSRTWLEAFPDRKAELAAAERAAGVLRPAGARDNRHTGPARGCRGCLPEPRGPRPAPGELRVEAAHREHRLCLRGSRRRR